MNIGEYFVSEYLSNILGYEYIITNKLIDGGREIDVVGIKKYAICFCEVAVHINGLRYRQYGGNQNNLVEKFRHIKTYASTFKKRAVKFSFWSPIVKKTAIDELKKAKAELAKENIDLELVINDEFLKRWNKLKEFTTEISCELKNPIMRMFQIETHMQTHQEYLRKHNLKKSKTKESK